MSTTSHGFRTLQIGALLASLLLSAFQVQARGGEPIADHVDVAVKPASGKALTAEQVGAAIAAAVDSERAEGNWPWARASQEGGGILATLRVRSKHTIRVGITWSADRYSLVYKGSDNMNYEVKKKGPIIHPFYNKWVTELMDEINAELAKL